MGDFLTIDGGTLAPVTIPANTIINPSGQLPPASGLSVGTAAAAAQGLATTSSAPAIHHSGLKTLIFIGIVGFIGFYVGKRRRAHGR